MLLLTQWAVRKISTEIINGIGDNLLAVKGNQKRLEQAFYDIFDLSDLQNENENTYGIQEQSHERLETRLHKVSNNIDALDDIAFEWPGRTRLGYVVSFRENR